MMDDFVEGVLAGMILGATAVLLFLYFIVVP